MKIVADANIPFVEECFSSVGQVSVLSGREIESKHLVDADALLVRSITSVNADLLDGTSVNFVGTATIGFDHIDRDYLAQRGIGFASAPGSNANSVAEYVIAALLEVARDHQIQLAGSSIGIVGVGNVGSRVKAKCHALGMEVYLNDPPLSRRTGDPKYLPLDKLYECDFITLHTPLTRDGVDRTYHLACGSFFDALKPGVVLLNTSRGAVAQTDALKAAIRSEKLRAAVLDVWENEPNIDNELLDMVTLASPHIAGYSFDGKVAGLIMIYEALCNHFQIAATKSAADFLPSPKIPNLEINSAEDQQEAIRCAVSRLYDIREDDANTRRILDKSAAEKGRYFDSLRKGYRRRREFQNTKVSMNPPNESLGQKLKGIGLHV